MKVQRDAGHVGLEGMERKYPSELSGGMQKRAALARALIRNPKILMLDEPTTGLDPTRTGSIHALIRHTQQRFGLTVVMVSHDVPAVFEISDRVAFMHEGRMRLTGTPTEVTAANDEVFNRFLGGQGRGRRARRGRALRNRGSESRQCTPVGQPSLSWDSSRWRGSWR